MANEMGTVRVVLDGFVGGPGLMQLRFQGGTPGVFGNADATAAIAAVGAFITAIKAYFPPGVTMAPQSDVEVTDWTNGDLVSIAAGTGYSAVAASGTGSVLAVEGPLLQWHTSTVVGHRMLRGRTYIVPAASALCIGANGLVPAAAQSALSAAGNALIGTAAVTLSVWHRPGSALAPVGTVGAAVNCTVPAKVSVLRSRRD